MSLFSDVEALAEKVAALEAVIRVLRAEVARNDEEIARLEELLSPAPPPEEMKTRGKHN